MPGNGSAASFFPAMMATSAAFAGAGAAVPSGNGAVEAQRGLLPPGFPSGAGAGGLGGGARASPGSPGERQFGRPTEDPYLSGRSVGVMKPTYKPIWDDVYWLVRRSSDSLTKYVESYWPGGKRDPTFFGVAVRM